MPLLTSEAEARARLQSACAWDSDPALTEADITMLLDRFKVGSVWATTTTYVYGDVVVPVTRNGHRYRVTTAGIGIATEPTWPLGWGSTVTDGTATLEEIGPEVDLWDIGAATHEAWKMKTALAAKRASITIGEHSKQAQQIFQQCQTMVLLTLPIQVA
jgi:hypothetical protein